MMLCLLCWCLLLFVAPVQALTTTTRQVTTTATNVQMKSRRCELYYFYDHGTEKCEFCCDICCNAKQKATTKQCDEECPEYAKKLQEDAKKLQEDTQKVETGGKPGQTAAGKLPLAKQIAIPLTVCALIILLSLLFIKFRAIVSKFRGLRAAISVSVRARPIPELVPLQQVISQQPTTNSRELDLPVWDQGEHPDPSSPSSPSCFVPSRRRSTTVITQESDKAGDGNSWQIWTTQQTASYHPEAREPSLPVEESVEGRQGRSVMELPNKLTWSAGRSRDNTDVKRIVDSQTVVESMA